MKKLVEAITLRFGKNVGIIDRILRILGSLIIGILIYQGYLNGTLAVGLGILVLMIIPTSITGKCSIYHTMGINSIKK